jgi:hypothetical protein
VIQRRVVDGICTSEVANPAPAPRTVPRGERLAVAVLAAEPLHTALAGRDQVELLPHHLHQRVEPGGVVLEAAARHQAGAQRADDLARFGNDGHVDPP